MKYFEVKEENDAFEEKCKKLIGKYGKVINFKLNLGTKPKAELENS